MKCSDILMIIVICVFHHAGMKCSDILMIIVICVFHYAGMKCSDILQIIFIWVLTLCGDEMFWYFAATYCFQLHSDLIWSNGCWTDVAVNYVPEAALFSYFPLFEDLRRFVSGILHSRCLERNPCLFQQFCSYDWRNALGTSSATNTFFFRSITLASTCSCSVTLKL